MDRILVIAPHPDDETLGCGGTLLKAKQQGHEINWLVVTNTLSRYPMLQKVEEVLGPRIQLGFMAACLDIENFGEIVKNIGYWIKEVRAEILYIPFHSDIHTDHQIVFKAAYSCTKQFRFPSIKQVFMHEVLSQTDFSHDVFQPNTFVGITMFMDEKIELMRCYNSELVYPRGPDNVRALATYRGGRIGVKYAEAFQLVLWKT